MAGFEIQPLVILLWSLLYFLYTLVFNLLYTLTIVFYRNGTLDLKPIKIKKKWTILGATLDSQVQLIGW